MLKYSLAKGPGSAQYCCHSFLWSPGKPCLVQSHPHIRTLSPSISLLSLPAFPFQLHPQVLLLLILKTVLPIFLHHPAGEKVAFWVRKKNGLFKKKEKKGGIHLCPLQAGSPRLTQEGPLPGPGCPVLSVSWISLPFILPHFPSSAAPPTPSLPRGSALDPFAPTLSSGATALL